MKKIFSLAIVASAFTCKEYRLPDGVLVIKDPQAKRIFEKMDHDQMQGFVQLCGNPKMVELLTGENFYGLLNIAMNHREIMEKFNVGGHKPLFTPEEVDKIRLMFNDGQYNGHLVVNGDLTCDALHVKKGSNFLGPLTIAHGQQATFGGPVVVRGPTTLVDLNVTGLGEFNTLEVVHGSTFNTLTTSGLARVDSLRVTNNATISRELQVGGSATIVGTLAFAQINPTGGTLIINGDLAVTGATIFGGLTTHNAGVTLGNNSNLTIGGTGTFTTGGNVTISGTTTFTGLTTHDGGVTLGQDKNFTMQGANARIINNQGVKFSSNVEIEGANTFTTGTGQVTLGQDVLIRHNLDVSGAGNIGTLAFAQITPTGGTLTINGSLAVIGPTTFARLTTHNGGVTLGNDQHFTMAGNGEIKNASGVKFGNDVNLLKNNFTMGNGAFTTGTGNVVLNGDVTLGNNKSLTLQGTGTFTTGGNVTIGGTTIFTGLTTHNAGIQIANAQNLTMGTAGNNAGDFIQHGTGTFTTGTGNVALNGDVTLGNNKSLTLQGNGTFSTGTGNVTIGGPTIFTGLTTHNAGIQIANAQHLTMGTVGNNAGNFIQQGTGTFSTGGNVTIGGTTIFTGLTTHNGGVNLGNDQHFTMAGIGEIKNSGGSPVLFGSSVKVNNANSFEIGTGNFTMGTGTFTTGTGNVALNGDVTLANNKNLTLQGTGTFSTGGNVTIGGTTTFSGLTKHNVGAEIMNSLIVKSGPSNLLSVNSGVGGLSTFSIGTNFERVRFDAYVSNAYKSKVDIWHTDVGGMFLGGAGFKSKDSILLLPINGDSIAV